ncbi:Rab family GTPase [Dokdonella koreensis]|nr:Rab family GTPase [Dokdonella koreensis]
MIRSSARKICMLGDFGVGKTSLVARFVHNTFSEKYLTTVGVKVDTCEVARTDGEPRKLVVWDMAGRNGIDTLGASYLRGASGLLLVVDGTRAATLRTALNLLMQARTVVPAAAAVLMVNKLDLIEHWEVEPLTVAELRNSLPVFETSALTGDGVVQAFATLAREIPE